MRISVAERRSLLARAHELESAYPATLRMSGARLRRSLDRSIATVARLRRSRAMIASSRACLAKVAHAQASRWPQAGIPTRWPVD